MTTTLSRSAKVTGRALGLLAQGGLHRCRELLGANPRPKFLVFYTTFRCNSRCRACNVWRGDDACKQREELTLDQVDRIFADPLFAGLNHVNVQGGEATLRDDLERLVAVLLRRLPALERISLTSNGLDSERVPAVAERLHARCRERGVEFGLTLSIDGVGPYHDHARGQDAFARVTATLEGLEKLRRREGFKLSTNCVLTAHNIDNLEEIQKFQQEVFNTTNLTVVEFREHFLNSGDTAAARKLLFTENEQARRKLLAFLEKRSVPEGPGDIMAYRYDQIRGMLAEGRPRTQACQYRIAGLVLDHRGNLQLCPIGGHLGSCLERTPTAVYYDLTTRRRRKELATGDCRRCYPYNFYPIELAVDLVPYLFWYLRRKRPAGGDSKR